MKVYEYILEFIVDLHKFELKRSEHQTNDYMDYYNAVSINDNVVRFDSPCLVRFDKVILYTEKDDDNYALSSMVSFLKTYYRSRIYSTQSALDTITEQFPNIRVKEPLEDVDIVEGDDE